MALKEMKIQSPWQKKYSPFPNLVLHKPIQINYDTIIDNCLHIIKISKLGLQNCLWKVVWWRTGDRKKRLPSGNMNQDLTLVRVKCSMSNWLGNQEQLECAKHSQKISNAGHRLHIQEERQQNHWNCLHTLTTNKCKRQIEKRRSRLSITKEIKYHWFW